MVSVDLASIIFRLPAGDRSTADVVVKVKTAVVAAVVGTAIGVVVVGSIIVFVVDETGVADFSTTGVLVGTGIAVEEASPHPAKQSVSSNKHNTDI